MPQWPPCVADAQLAIDVAEVELDRLLGDASASATRPFGMPSATSRMTSSSRGSSVGAAPRPLAGAARGRRCRARPRAAACRASRAAAGARSPRRRRRRTRRRARRRSMRVGQQHDLGVRRRLAGLAQARQDVRPLTHLVDDHDVRARAPRARSRPEPRPSTRGDDPESRGVAQRDPDGLARPSGWSATTTRVFIVRRSVSRNLAAYGGVPAPRVRNIPPVRPRNAYDRSAGSGWASGSRRDRVPAVRDGQRGRGRRSASSSPTVTRSRGGRCATRCSEDGITVVAEATTRPRRPSS